MSNRIDLLNRGTFIENVIKVVNQLSENKKGCCFAIEGGWGVGKTFVIEEVEDQLKETNTEKYFVFHYNCWQHDYYEEPAVAIISAMIASIQKDNVIVNEDIDNAIEAGCKIAVDKLKEIAGTFIENKIGVNLISLADEIKEKKEEAENSVFEFDELFNFSQTIEKARENLQEIAKERTIVLVVDELDRCIPQYAIKVLERLHHIFYGLDNVVVIMAIDRKQLEHSVEEMFGTKNDADSMDIEKYLKKFIDFSMILDYGIINESLIEKYKFYFDKFVVNNPNDFEKGLQLLQDLLDEVDIRKQEKIVDKANLVHSIICNVQVDVSILFFEIMYEIIEGWRMEDLSYVVLIGSARYPNAEQKLGTRKIEILKSLNEKSFSIVNGYGGTGTQASFRVVKSDLFGKVFWYFYKVFCDESGIYKDLYDYMKTMTNEIDIAKKYCEFCKIIK